MTLDLIIKNSILSPYKPRKLAVGEVDIMEAVPEEYPKTVVFLCVAEATTNGTKTVPRATGFFVRVPLEGSTEYALDYVVTARHCIEEARPYGKIYIRENLKSGLFIELPTKVDDWHTHDNADVAAIAILRNALPSNVQHTDIDQTSLIIKEFVGGSPDYKITVNTPFGQLREIQPRVGHQVYFLGLFTQHYGTECNLPIARFGHISRMPSRVTIEVNNTQSEVIAYLVEFHSWGGHSGSPVFFLYPTMAESTIPVRFDDGKQVDMPIETNLIWTTGFMGLISGHYDITQKAEKTGDILGEIQVELNSGIAIVTPAEAVTQLLMREDLVKHRKEVKKIAESKRPLPTLDIADAKKRFTKDDFFPPGQGNAL